MQRKNGQGARRRSGEGARHYRDSLPPVGHVGRRHAQSHFSFPGRGRRSQGCYAGRYRFTQSGRRVDRRRSLFLPIAAKSVFPAMSENEALTGNSDLFVLPGEWRHTEGHHHQQVNRQHPPLFSRRPLHRLQRLAAADAGDRTSLVSSSTIGRQANTRIFSKPPTVPSVPTCGRQTARVSM